MTFNDFISKNWKAILIFILTISAVILIFIFFNKIISGLVGLSGAIAAKLALAKKEKEHEKIINDTNSQIEDSKKRQEEIKKQLEAEGLNSIEIEKRMKEIDSKIKNMTDEQLLKELKKMLNR
jgi:predicted Holliday junction resolvase-like endonuclease